MEKVYTNATGEDSTALPSGEGSSIGSQWDAGLDLDVAQAIITSSFQKQGYQTSCRNVSGTQSGEMSLEEEVNSLDLKQVVIDDDEIKEMEKEQASAAVKGEQNASEKLTRVFSSVDGHTGRENVSAGDSRQTTSDNDLLNDIDSLIASSLSRVDSNLANGWLETPDWTIANGHQNGIELNADLNRGHGTRKSMKTQAHISSSSSTPTDQHLQFGEDVSCQSSLSSTLLIKSPSTISDVSSQLENTCIKAVSPKLSPGIAAFQPSPQSFHSQATNPQDKMLPKNDAVDVESADSVSRLSQHQENLLSPASTQYRTQNQDALSVKDLESRTDCLMCPVRYADDDDCESNDLDEHCSSGELIPHGRGSGRGRPKSAQPIRSSVPCEIRPKTDLPTYTNNLIPVTVIVRTEDNKNCLELHPVVSQTPHKPAPSISSGISSASNEAASPPIDINLLPDSVKSTSMECVEGDGPVSLTGSSHQVLVPGHMSPIVHAQNILSHSQGYRTGHQYDGTVFTQQPMHSRTAMNQYIPNHPLQHADIQEQRNLHQYQEEPPFQYRNKQSVHPSQTLTSYKNLLLQNPRSEIRMTGHQKMVPAQQPPILAYQEIHPEPSRMAASYYTEHPSEGSNLVVADPKQLEKAGIPYIIVSQASVPNHPTPQRAMQTSANSVHSHKPYLPQPQLQQGPDGRPYMNTGGNSQMYQQAPTGNTTAAQIMEQPVYNQLSKVNPAVHYIGDPQNKMQSAYYVPPSVTSIASVESSNLPSSRIIYQVPQQQPVTMVHGTTLPSTVDPGMLLSSSKPRNSRMREPVRACPNGFHPLQRNSSTHINPKLDCRGIPREDKQSRTEAWILQNSKVPSHHVHPYESNRHIVSCSGAGPTLPPKAVGLFQGVEIAVPNSGPGMKKNSGNVGDVKHKGTKKGRASGKVKEVDTINSHQGYIKKLPSKVQVNETLGHSSQEGDNLNTARPPSNDSSNIDKQVDRIMLVQKGNNMSKNHVREQLNVVNGKIRQDKTRYLRDDFAEADKEIDKIMFEKSMRESQQKSGLDSLEKYSALLDEPLFDYPLPSDATSQNLGVVAATSISQTTASSQVWNIDPNQYLSSKDKESLEENIHRQNNSLEKYLRMGTTNNSSKNMSDPNSQTHLQNHLVSSGEILQHPVQCDESRLMGWLDHSQRQKAAQPPKDLAKIDILAWRQQSVAVVEPQFDIANPSANDFPQLLQSLTSPGDEDMKSASLEVSDTSRNASAKHCLNPSPGPINISVASCLSQHHLSNACGVQTTLSMNDIGEVPASPLLQYFRKPHHPAIKHPSPAKYLPYDNTNTHSQQTSLSACISHPQPLMASSIALASSQPVSSVKGDSDVSMQSDLSRRSRLDRSMNSVDEKLQQIPEFKQALSAAVIKDKSRNNQRETKVKEWLENQETYLKHQACSNSKMCQEHLDAHALTLNIPNHLDCIDHEEMLQQHQPLPEAKQQKFQQEHQVLQQIPPPSSPPFDINSPFLDHLHDELDYGPYVVPGFSPTDLMPRCGGGKSDKPPSRPQSGSQSIKDKGRTPTSSSISQAIGSETSTNHISTSIPSPLPPSNKQLNPNQETAKSGATLKISCPTNSVIMSSPSCHVSISSPSGISKGDHSRLVSSRPSARDGSNYSSPAAKAGSNYSSPDNSQIVKTKDSSIASPSHKASDVLVVGERMKTCVKISHVSKPHHEGAAAADDDDEEEEEEEDVEDLGEGEEKGEEEELSFTGSDVFRPDDQGETILHCLCDITVDHFEVLESAPGFKEAVNSSNKAQETPLFVGVHNRRPDIAKFLMKKGADVSIPCISPANTFRNEPLLQSALHEAAELGDAKTLNVLLQSEDVDIDLPRPGSGQTPLMVALHIHSFAHRNSAANRTRVVKLLLTQGASMTIQDAVEGKTPFMYAIQSRDVEIVNTFFRLMDADEARDAVTTKTSRSTTCLHFAAGLSNFDRSQKMELIRILILNGADASSKNAEGESPRDWARDEIDEVLRRLVPGR